MSEIESVSEAKKLNRLLLKLATNTCTQELWEECAVEHYRSPVVESCRRILVRQAIGLPNLRFDSFPDSLSATARDLAVIVEKFSSD